MPRRGEAKYAPPTAGEIETFNKLLLSGNFDEGDYHIHTLQVCAGWLVIRQHDVWRWILEFRRNRSKLLETLLKIQKDLTGLCSMMDRLSGEYQSFFTDSPFNIPNTIFALHSEYLAINDSVGNLLEPYLSYAKSYEMHYKKGEIPDMSNLSVKPEDLSAQFLEKLGLIQQVLGKMATGVANLAARRADLADPGAGPAATGS
jgi:hypothetical protein